MDTDADAYCAALTRDQRAWEFLRRNPDYRRDYAACIAIWRALEADYGVPPNRDFSKWKHDPRAYGPLPGDGELASPTGELCVVEDERVLLNAGWAACRSRCEALRKVERCRSPLGTDWLAGNQAVSRRSLVR